MPDINKLELSVKSHEARLGGVERAIDTLKKTASVEALTKEINGLKAAVATKQEVKSETEKAKKEGEKVAKETVKELEKLEKLHLDMRLTHLEGLVTGIMERLH